MQRLWQAFLLSRSTQYTLINLGGRGKLDVNERFGVGILSSGKFVGSLSPLKSDGNKQIKKVVFLFVFIQRISEDQSNSP